MPLSQRHFSTRHLEMEEIHVQLFTPGLRQENGELKEKTDHHGAGVEEAFLDISPNYSTSTSTASFVFP